MIRERGGGRDSEQGSVRDEIRWGGGEIQASIRIVGRFFVANLPLQLHWKGIWHVFDRHGTILYVFVPTKRARDGSRFGFIRMKTKADVDRIIEHFDGFWLYGSRIRVHLVMNGNRRFYRRKKRSPSKSDTKLDHQSDVAIILGVNFFPNRIEFYS
ncbi:hypothetical protein V6N13_034359 [Hibiscus sabdariffa]